jgi:hypothetical protein
MIAAAQLQTRVRAGAHRVIGSRASAGVMPMKSSLYGPLVSSLNVRSHTAMHPPRIHVALSRRLWKHTARGR